MTVRAYYRATDPLSILRYRVPKRSYAIGESVTVGLLALNASEAPTITTPILALVDSNRKVATREIGAPWALPAGSARAIALSATAPITPGRYTSVLSLASGGSIAGRAAKPIVVTAAEVAGWSAEEPVHAGQAARFTASLRHYVGREMDVVLSTYLSAPDGSTVGEIGPVTLTLPAGMPEEVDFVWDVPRDAQVGEYRAVVHGAAGGYRILPESLRFEVVPPIRLHLPVLRRND
jgi:hypothetical protein